MSISTVRKMIEALDEMIRDVDSEHSDDLTRRFERENKLDDRIRELEQENAELKRTRASGLMPTDGIEGTSLKELVGYAMAHKPEYKINFIKDVRALTNWGLKEAKDFVEDALLPF